MSDAGDAACKFMLTSNETPEFVDLTDDDVDLKTIRRQCDVLVRSEKVDKEAALQILRIQHAMETLFFTLRHKSTSEIESLRSELTLTKLTHTNASAITDLTQDGSRSRRDIKDLQEFKEKTNSQIGDMTKRLADLDARILSALSKRR